VTWPGGRIGSGAANIGNPVFPILAAHVISDIAISDYTCLISDFTWVLYHVISEIM
jgi:hypothetical protein